MKAGERVLIGPLMGKPDAQGKPAQIKATLTTILPGRHGLVKFTSISDGIFIAVKDDGNYIILGPKEKLPEGAMLLKVGDEATFALGDLTLDPEHIKQYTKMPREEAERYLGKFADVLDQEKFSTMPDEKGLYSRFELERMKTICENVDREQFRFGDEAQEFGKLAGKYMNKVFPNSVR